MSRSLYKPNFVHRSLFIDCLENKQKKVLLNTKKQTPEVIYKEKHKSIPRFFYFWAKNSLINLNLLDKKIAIYNGKVFVSLNIIKRITGYRLGAFCITRKKPPHIGKQRQIKKVSRAHEKMVAERKRIVNKGKFRKK